MGAEYAKGLYGDPAFCDQHPNAGLGFLEFPVSASCSLGKLKVTISALKPSQNGPYTLEVGMVPIDRKGV